MRIRMLSEYPMLVGRLVTTFEQQHAPRPRRRTFVQALVCVGVPLFFMLLVLCAAFFTGCLTAILEMIFVP